MTGKKYSFATTILGARMLGDKAFEYNQVVSYSFMQQLAVCVCVCLYLRKKGATFTYAIPIARMPPPPTPATS
jgi:hypothetical protein